MDYKNHFFVSRKYWFIMHRYWTVRAGGCAAHRLMHYVTQFDAVEFVRLFGPKSSAWRWKTQHVRPSSCSRNGLRSTRTKSNGLWKILYRKIYNNSILDISWTHYKNHLKMFYKTNYNARVEHKSWLCRQQKNKLSMRRWQNISFWTDDTPQQRLLRAASLIIYRDGLLAVCPWS